MPPFMNTQPPVANAGGDPRMNNPLAMLLTQGMPNINQQQPPGPQIPAPRPAPTGMPSVGGGQAPSPAALDIGLGGNQGQVPQGPTAAPDLASIISDKMARVGAQAPTPPINPVVEQFDNTPPIVREAIRRRLFTQGM